MIVLVLLVSKIVHSAWNHERAGRTISRWVSETLSGRGGPTKQAFTFGRVDYPWLGAVWSLVGGRPVRFDAWDVHIWDPDGKEVLYASHVNAGLRLHRLVGAKVWGALPGTKPDLELHFVDSIVDKVRCQIAPGPDGKVNIVAACSSRVKTPPTGGGMVISVAGSVVKDGQFRMHFPGWEAEIDHFHLRHDSLRYSSFPSEQRHDSPAFTYVVPQVIAPTGHLTIGGYTFPLEDVVSTDFRAEEPRRQDMVLRGTAHSRGSTVAVAGRLTELYTDQRGVELSMHALHGAKVLAQLPSKDYLHGDANATAHLHGPFTEVVIDGAAHNVEAKLVGLEIANIAAHYELAHHALHLDHVTSDVAGGHVRGSAAIDWHNPQARTWHADVELEGIKTLELGSLAPAEIAAYLAGIPYAIFHGGPTDSVEHLKLKGIDFTLYRRPRDPLPHRLVMVGHLG